MVFALKGSRVFDGDAMRDGLAIIVDGNRIREVAPIEKISRGVKSIELEGGILAPGFIDVQVNGGGGALLNDNPTLETVKCIAESHRKFGTTGMLPTVITDAPNILAQAIGAVRDAQNANIPGVLGIHIEGPFLDVDRKGAHDPQYIRDMTIGDVGQIAEAKCGVVMITLAPNRVPTALIKSLVVQNILVSLGHSNATAVEIQAALDAGASAFTHIFNAMSQLTGREPGMVGMALADDKSYCGLIADGLHVHDIAMKVAIAAKAKSRVMLISDAMPAAAGGPDEFELQGRTVTRVDGRLILDDGTLAGSNLTMDEALRHCVNKLDVGLEDALRMTSLNPASFMHIDHELGRIRPGYRASLVHLSDSLEVKQTWIDGK